MCHRRRAAPPRQQRRVHVHRAVRRQLEQCQRQDLAICGHNDALGYKVADLPNRCGIANAARCEHAYAQVGGGIRHRSRRRTTPVAGFWRLGDDGGEVMPRSAGAEGRDRECSGPQEDEPHTAWTMSGSSASLTASISRRVPSLTRVVKRMPSRWSISCWMARASRPSPLIRTA